MTANTALGRHASIETWCPAQAFQRALGAKRKHQVPEGGPVLSGGERSLFPNSFGVR